MANETKQDLWKERVESFQASGLSRRAWCLEHNIPEHQMGYWTRKLQLKSAEPETRRWVGLETAAQGDTGVSIQVGDVTLVVRRDFDHTVLVDVVRALLTVC